MHLIYETDAKAEGEGVEPSRLIARLISNQVPSPFGLPFQILKGDVPVEALQPTTRTEHRREESNLQSSP
jgi:hypothetical protein